MKGYVPRTYRIGADPELFVQNVETGVFISAHDLVPGSKFAPERVNKGAIQPDGVAAEFNIAPAVTGEEFSDNIRIVLLQLHDTVTKNAKDRLLTDVQLKVIPTADFDSQYFALLPSRARELGCTPDYDAYLARANAPPKTKESFRTGAGHIHVGWSENEDPNDDSHWWDCLQATKQLDASLYFTSLLWDNDNRRRKLYGKIGAFRPKHYGVEYRPLSNMWVADPDLHVFIFRTAHRSMELLDDEDVNLFDDLATSEMVGRVLDGEIISRPELLSWHRTFTKAYQLPVLPDRYLKEVA